jgi:iron complex outermembrane receptor protein
MINKPSLMFAAIAVTLPVSLHAAEFQLEEVIITAQKRSESMQDVPISVSALSSDDLEGLKLRGTGEIASQIPNLQASGVAGDGMPIFSLRGVSMNDFSFNQNSPVAVYMDEVYKGNPSLLGVQLYDLERVEVLRGPQGTLYGKNSTGGAVNFIAQKPNFEAYEGYLTLGAGNFNRKKVEGAFNAPISDSLAMRLAVTTTEADGWQENKTAGVDDGSAIDEYGARLSVLWEASDTLELILRAATGKAEAVNYGIVAANVGPGGIGAGIYGLYDSLGASNPDTGEAYVDGTRDGLGFTEFESGQDAERLVENDSISLTVNWDFGKDLTLTSITSYDEGKAYVPEDADGSANILLNAIYDVDVEQFAQDLRITSDYAGSFNFISGIYFSEEDVHNENSIDYTQDLDINIDGALDYVDCQDPLLGAFGLDGISPEGQAVDVALGGTGDGAVLGTLAGFGCKTANSFDQKRTSYAIYADGNYDLNDRWTLRLGARYTNDKSELSDYVANYLGSDDVLVFPTIDIAKDEFTDEEVTGKLGLDYTTDEGNLIYASFSHGYRSGAFNAQAFQDPSEVTQVAPETLDAFEVGFKSTFFDNLMQLNGAAFFYTYDNQQFLNVDENLIQTLVNIDESEITGLELELVSRPLEPLMIRAGLGLIDAEVSKGFLGGVNLKGNQLPQAPDVNFNLSADWEMLNMDAGTLTLHGDTTFTDTQYFDVFNVGRIEADSYWLTGAQLTFEGADSRWAVSVWGKNLTDEEYNTSIIDLQAFFGYDYTHVGARRSYGADVTFRF